MIQDDMMRSMDNEVQRCAMGGPKLHRAHQKCEKNGMSEQKRLTDGGRNKES
jgi:hypothetical protein